MCKENLYAKMEKFNSQLNTSGREPTICDTPVSHSIDIPTEELKVLWSLEHLASSHNTGPTIWRLKYEGVQDRALKLYPAVMLL